MTDSKTATELLPCPFCGSANIDEYEGDYGNGVYCMSCGAMMGEPIHYEYRVTERVSYEKAAEAWNTRTPEQAIAATLGSGTLTAKQVREAVKGHGNIMDMTEESGRQSARERIKKMHDFTISFDWDDMGAVYVEAEEEAEPGETRVVLNARTRRLFGKFLKLLGKLVEEQG